MGGFKKLQTVVEEGVPKLENPFEKMLICCLFEIAGNLDTLAISSRIDSANVGAVIQHISGLAAEVRELKLEIEELRKIAKEWII